HKTNYRSGHELSTDYAAGYSLTPVWQAGASGYVYKQTTGDTQNGSEIPGGNQGRAFAIGPYVRYKERTWGVALKWQNESAVENRPRGNRYVLQFGLLLK